MGADTARPGPLADRGGAVEDAKAGLLWPPTSPFYSRSAASQNKLNQRPIVLKLALQILACCNMMWE